MTRTESSVSLSVKALLDAEERRRAEQIIVANRLKQEQERLASEESARRAHEAKLRAEAALAEMRQRAQCDREAAERLELERLAHLERTRAELELTTKTALLRLEQQNELERLTLQRDARVRRLAGQRVMIGALLVTFVIGAVAIYGLVLRPGRVRLEADVAKTLQLAETRRIEADRERDRLLAMNAEQVRAERKLRERIAELERALLAAKKSPSKPGPHGGEGVTVRPPVVPPPCTCAKADPLCDCW